MATTVTVDETYDLDDKYTRESGSVYLTGTQALVRLPMMQRRLDVAQGLNTAGMISGYPGSPLGGYDLALRAHPDREPARAHPSYDLVKERHLAEIEESKARLMAEFEGHRRAGEAASA